LVVLAALDPEFSDFELLDPELLDPELLELASLDEALSLPGEVTAAPLPLALWLLADAAGSLDGLEGPVESRMRSMMSDFFSRDVALTPSAFAISSRVSLSLDSKTDCSSAAAATRFLSSRSPTWRRQK
jgi:hypothetical protein